MASDLPHPKGATLGKNDSFDPEAVADAMLPLLGLTLTSTSRAAVIAHLRMAANHARTVLSVKLDDEEEPAPVYRP